MAITPVYPLPNDQGGLSDALTTLRTDDAEGFAWLQIVCERWLGFDAPALADDPVGTVDLIRGYIVRQMNFAHDQGLAPAKMKAANMSHPGVANQYRDRYVDPGALAGAMSITGAVAIDFSPPFGPGT